MLSLLKKEKVMSVKEFMEIDKIKEFELCLSKDKRLEKFCVFTLASLMHYQQILAKNANFSKIDQAGKTLLGIAEAFGYWVCIILCILEILRKLMEGDTKSIGKIISKYVVGFSALHFLPWIFDIIQEIFK